MLTRSLRIVLNLRLNLDRIPGMRRFLQFFVTLSENWSSTCAGAPPAGMASLFTDAAGACALWPFGLSRNCTFWPGTTRISVENRSESSLSFFQRRVWSLPSAWTRRHLRGGAPAFR